MNSSALRECCLPKEKERAMARDAEEPLGPREEDVEALVQEILKDASINISVIPDSVERLLYKSTIQLTLNAFYSMFASLEGTKFLAHEIRLKTSSQADHQSRSLMEPNPTSDIDDLVLEEVATRVFANKAVNQRFWPYRI